MVHLTSLVGCKFVKISHKFDYSLDQTWKMPQAPRACFCKIFRALVNCGSVLLFYCKSAFLLKFCKSVIWSIMVSVALKGMYCYLLLYSLLCFIANLVQA